MKRTLLAVFAAGLVSAAGAAEKTAEPAVLTAGTYQATVKALVCEGCGPFIERTLERNPSLEKVSVDQKKKTVTFGVKKGSEAKVAELQKALDAAAQDMGMGADYHLRGIKKSS